MVWLPVLRAGNLEAAARREAGRVPDPRAIRFYDPEARLGKAYSEVLHLSRGMPAWDAYLVFAPEVRWPEANGQQKPPAPTYWMHQMGRAAPAELLLDGEKLARVVTGLLGKSEGGVHRSSLDYPSCWPTRSLLHNNESNRLNTYVIHIHK